MKNNFKILKTRKKGFTPTPSFLLSKSGLEGNPKKKNLVWGFTPPTFAKKVGGFTLIEMLVGITILLVAVIGPLYTAFQGVSLSLLARDQITASFLAQEGIEFVRFRIGTNKNALKVGKFLISSGTPYDLTKCSWQLNTGKSCTVDMFKTDPTAAITECNGDCPYLRYSTTTRKYDYETGGDTYETFFRRSIRVDHNNALAPDKIMEFQVESKVEWGKPGDIRSIVLKDVIRDWQP